MQAQGKFSRNFIIGVSFLIALVLLYFGVNFLKGTNILKKQNTYVVLFDDVTGLYPSSPVYVNGFQIGLVNVIKMNSTDPIQFAVDINLEGDYRIPRGSYFEFGSDLLGASTVSLVANKEVSQLLIPGDTLYGRLKPGMMNSVANVAPKADSILTHIDSVVLTLNKLMSNPMWEQSIAGIGSTVAQLDQKCERHYGVDPERSPHRNPKPHGRFQRFKRRHGRAEFTGTPKNVQLHRQYGGKPEDPVIETDQHRQFTGEINQRYSTARQLNEHHPYRDKTAGRYTGKSRAVFKHKGASVLSFLKLKQICRPELI